MLKLRAQTDARVTLTALKSGRSASRNRLGGYRWPGSVFEGLTFGSLLLVAHHVDASFRRCVDYTLDHGQHCANDQ